MGTRSMTFVIDEHTGQPVVGMYRQMDGYPTGHGQDLKEFLEDMVVGNGIGMNMPEKYANGMGCLAAQMVSHFKDGAGGIYLMNGYEHGQDYDYYIYLADRGGIKRIFLRIVRHGVTIYDGYAARADMEKIELQDQEDDAPMIEDTKQIDGPVSVEGEDLN